MVLRIGIDPVHSTRQASLFHNIFGATHCVTDSNSAVELESCCVANARLLRSDSCDVVRYEVSGRNPARGLSIFALLLT